MNILINNPAQLVTVSVFTFGANWLLNAIPPNWLGSIPLFLIWISVMTFIVLVNIVIQIGHLIDFVNSPESSIRGLFVELYDFDGESGSHYIPSRIQSLRVSLPLTELLLNARRPRAEQSISNRIAYGIRWTFRCVQSIQR